MSTEITDAGTFADRLKAAREANGITQADLGAGLGKDGIDLGKGAVSAWEVGTSIPNANQVKLICHRLGVSADSLLGTAEAKSA